MADKASLLWNFVLPKGPMLMSTTLSHYTYGPLKPSWSYKFSLIMAMAQSMSGHMNDKPLKQFQAMSRLNDKLGPVHPGANASDAVVPNNYRDKAAAYLDQLLNQEGIDLATLGWDWKNDPRAARPLKAEWTETKVKDANYSEGRTVLYLHGGGYFLCSIKTHRWASWNMARLGGAKVFCKSPSSSPRSHFPVRSLTGIDLLSLLPAAKESAKRARCAKTRLFSLFQFVIRE